MKKTYTITVEQIEGENISVKGINEGFSLFELLGAMEYAKNDILLKVRSINKNETDNDEK
jgi:hypothetical protein